MPSLSHCRICEGVCGVVADIDGGGIRALRTDPADPISLGAPCRTLAASEAARTSTDRIRQPLRRVGDGFEPVSWDVAIGEIGSALGALRGQHGAAALGLYLGRNLPRRSSAFVRSLAFGVGLGTPNIFSEWSEQTGPLLRMAELMLGHSAWLIPDVGRAHYVLAFGDHDEELAWGPSLLGRCHLSEVRHSQKTKGTKLVCVGPRRSVLADEATQHIATRPGTEGLFLLGMLVAIVRGGWSDAQYVRDYTDGWDALVAALEPWTVEQCAEACGISGADISGVALKFSRAAMAAALPGPGTFQGANGGLAAWAWLALHTVTANTLRPGGIYDHVAPIDIQAILDTVPTAGAPHNREGQPLHLLQLPAAALGPELEGDDAHRLRSLVVVDGDPARQLAASPRVASGLEKLDLMVCLATHPSATTALADWVLPMCAPFEEPELELVDQGALPRQTVRFSAALVPPEGEARPAEAILRDLHQSAGVGVRGGVYGLHVGMLGQYLSGADLDAWGRRVCGWSLDIDVERIYTEAQVELGVSDRSIWRTGNADGRVKLLPDAILALLSAVKRPELDDARPLFLWTSRRLDNAPDSAHRVGQPDPGIMLHPDAGFADGALVRVATAAGSVAATVTLDERLRPDVACVPMGHMVDAMALVSADVRDPLLGTVARDGSPCVVTPA